jgi:hypothetical protein
LWCRVEARAEAVGGREAIVREGRVYLALGAAARLTAEELVHVRVVLRAIAATLPGADPVVVVVDAVTRVLTDYQPEGVACALAAWARTELGVALPAIEARFDAVNRRYVVDLGALERPDS